MTNRSKVRTCLYLFFILVTIVASSACAKPPAQPIKEAPPSALEPAVPQEPAPPAQQGPQKAPPPPPATIAEARAAVERVYKDSVSVASNVTPSFTVGDFNGDGSQDIAVVVKPVKEKLADINQELASWMVRDPLAETLPQLMIRQGHNEPKPRPVITERDETLLAVIHGYEATGWRNPEAQQTYLLKSAVGENIRTEPKKNLLKVDKDKRPPLLGDVIKESIAGQPGFIFYTGATYAWYDPRYYKPEPPRRMVH
ncbi:MAG: FG-GAP repeat protein [Blastocatellia bacterium]